MRLSGSNNPSLWGLLFCASLAGSAAAAGDYGIQVSTADLHRKNGNYAVSASIDFKLSPKAIEALKNGVSLYWTYQFTVHEQRAYLWNRLLTEKKVRYRIQYHALPNIYRVRNEENGVVNNVYNLEAALAVLSGIRDLPLIEAEKIAGDANYVAGIKIDFDRDALPLPLRPVSYVNPQWFLSSDWYTWTVTK
jgi:Domain of unknown function (DUF4390)